MVLQFLPDQLDVVLGDLRGQQALLARVAPEDVREARREDHPEAVILQCPYRMLAGGAGAEVGPGHQHRAAVERLLVQDEVILFAPGRKQRVFETGTRDALEVHRRNDLVRVDIGLPQRNADAGVGGEFFHGHCFP
jgi:hypothetical protein